MSPRADLALAVAAHTGLATAESVPVVLAVLEMWDAPPPNFGPDVEMDDATGTRGPKACLSQDEYSGESGQLTKKVENGWRQQGQLAWGSW